MWQARIALRMWQVLLASECDKRERETSLYNATRATCFLIVTSVTFFQNLTCASYSNVTMLQYWIVLRMWQVLLSSECDKCDLLSKFHKCDLFEIRQPWIALRMWLMQLASQSVTTETSLHNVTSLICFRDKRDPSAMHRLHVLTVGKLLLNCSA